MHGRYQPYQPDMRPISNHCERIHTLCAGLMVASLVVAGDILVGSGSHGACGRSACTTMADAALLIVRFASRRLYMATSAPTY